MVEKNHKTRAYSVILAIVEKNHKTRAYFSILAMVEKNHKTRAYILCYSRYSLDNYKGLLCHSS